MVGKYFEDVQIGKVTLQDVTSGREEIGDWVSLKSYLEFTQIVTGLLNPYHREYPVIEARELEPPFDLSLLEHGDLPGFSMVALDRSLDYQREIFQFDLFHSPQESSSPEVLTLRNQETFLSRLPRPHHSDFVKAMEKTDITSLQHYGNVLQTMFAMDRGHVIARGPDKGYRLLGVYASFPSDLDREIKRFGFETGKFQPGSNRLYERNRLFVYKYLMELFGYPIASERRTSAAMFARRLMDRNENFIISVLATSDRVITLISSRGKGRWPLVEKFALVSLDAEAKDTIQALDEGGYWVDPLRRVVLLKVTYMQHDYNPQNVIEDRALSVVDQEAVHPITGAKLNNIQVLKTVRRRLVRLNDLVRGEHEGHIVFQGQEMVYGTEDHLSRLKFLHAWIHKHRRTLLGYSARTFRHVESTLDSYLNDGSLSEEFSRHASVYKAVQILVETLKQEYQVMQLMRALESKGGSGSRTTYRDRLVLLLEFLYRESELMQYQEEVFEKALFLCDGVLGKPYFRKRYQKGRGRTHTPYEQEVLYLYDQLMMQRNRLEWRYFRFCHASDAV